MKVAIVHEWLEHYAGSERVLESLLALFPRADLFALVDFVPEGERDFLQGRLVQTSFIQRLPFARRYFRNYLGLMPLAVEQLDVSGYDLVISSNHAVAKGVITGPDQIHICYVHSPMRYAWDLQPQYLRQSGLDRGIKGAYARWLLHRLRTWDVRSSTGVDVFVANSSYIADRIRKAYRRKATVIHPPVAVDRFTQGEGDRTEYLVASRFVPYKRVDLIAEAFVAMPQHRLIIVGDGPERERVQRAVGLAPNITVRPPVDQPTLVKLMQQSRAFIYAAEEDFGITMVEAQACGAPLIAFGRGGACDIVNTGRPEQATGILFRKQTSQDIVSAVESFEANLSHSLTATACNANAQRFSEANFHARFMDVVYNAMKELKRPWDVGPPAEPYFKPIDEVPSMLTDRPIRAASDMLP